MKRFSFLFLFCILLLPILHAQWQPCNGPYGGSIRGLFMKDQNIFAVTDQQGVFFSSDNGNTWSPRNNGLTNYSATNNTVKGNRIFLGTSSGLFVSQDDGAIWSTVLINGVADYPINAIGSNAQSVFILDGDTLLRSNDDGVTWTKLFYGQNYYSIGINGNNIFVGTTGRTLYRSSDNGENFASIDLTYFGNLYNLGSFTFSGSSVLATAGGVIFKSTDNGETWAQSTNGITDAVVSLTASGNKFYAGCYSEQVGYPNPPDNGGLFVSEDEGSHWTSLGMKSYTVENIVFPGNRMVASTLLNGIFISDDGGLTWSTSNNGLIRLPVWALAQNGSALFTSCSTTSYNYSEYFYDVQKSQDQGMNWVRSSSGMTNIPVSVFAVGPSFMIAGGQGVYISYDNGLTWQSVFNPGYSINTLLISGSQIFAGTNGGMFLSDDGGTTWHSANNGLGNTTILSMTTKGNIVFAGTSSGVYRTVDSGSTWSPAQDGMEGYSVAAMASNSSYLFASGSTGSSGIFRSSDNGDHWFRVNIDFSVFSYVNCFAVSNEKIFAGTSDMVSQVLFSNDNGNTWSVTRTGLPPGFIIPALVILDSEVYAALEYDYPYNITGSGVWKRPLSEFIPFTLTGDTLVMLESAGDIKTLGITSETAWELNGTLPAWLNVDKTSGNGSDVLTFTTLQANSSQQKRYTSLEVVSEGITRYCTIVQKEKLNGIEDLLSPAVSIFPNPTSGSVIIESTARYDKLTVYSAPGQILSEQVIASPESRLDLSQYGKGVYYIRLSGEKGSCIRQVVVL
jgi:photosystem II stability/assembly factor-like uncharacterized protein